MVLHRSAVVDGAWRDAIEEQLPRLWIENLLRSGFADTVLVAPKRSKRFAEELWRIEGLRDLGLGE